MSNSCTFLRNSPLPAPWMTRWSYVLVSVMVLPTPSSASVAADMPWNSAGYSSAPAPMIAPWPRMSRGTECTVPMPPGLVREIVLPWKSSAASLLSRARLTTSS